VLVSPTEPPVLKALGTVSSLPESYGSDFLIVGGQGELVGIQRKETKDWVASVFDGRLAVQDAKSKSLHQLIIVVEGKWGWSNDGVLLEQYGKRYTRSMHIGLCCSMQASGVWLLSTEGLQETAGVLKDIERWWGKEEHRGLSRPGPERGEWGKSSNRDWGIHVLQSFEGIGKEMAGRIWDRFKGVPLKWDVTQKEMMGVEGLGKVKVKRMWEALNGNEEAGA